MTHSQNKEASQLLCDAMWCRVEDGDPDAEEWTDSAGNAVPPDRFWNTGLETLIAADSEGDCKWIEVNIWERAKMCCLLYFIDIITIMLIIRIILCCCVGTTSYRAHFGWRWRTALDYRRIQHGDAGNLSNYPILSYLPDEFARFLYEFHVFRFESLDLPPLPADRSDLGVHGELKDAQIRVQRLLHYLLAIVVCNILYLLCRQYKLYILLLLIQVLSILRFKPLC
jgi:hypothetical protein